MRVRLALIAILLVLMSGQVLAGTMPPDFLRQPQLQPKPAAAPSARPKLQPKPPGTKQIPEHADSAPDQVKVCAAPALDSARSMLETHLSIGVLGFFVLVLGLEVLVMLRTRVTWGPTTVRIFGLTLVINSGLFLITAGYSQDQIAPMMGLLGTIAGYLLGKTEPKTRKTAAPETDVPAPAPGD